MIKNNKIGVLFIAVGVMALIAGLFFGVLAAMQFVFPGTVNDLGFIKTRPLHVSLVVAWIFLASIGGIYYYLPNFGKLKWHNEKLLSFHFIVFIITGVLILIAYTMGKFGGREYWEFPPVLSIPIFITWILFGWNYFKTIFKQSGQWPVYYWMWATGIVFFFFTFLESYLWIIPYFRENIIRELTVQWKSYGALVGSWNMLVYGTAIFVMEKISGDEKTGKSKLAFLMYFLGLTNLMFGWAHHIYNVPTAKWIRYFAYFISMTELIILAKIIISWKNAMGEHLRAQFSIARAFIIASDVWIFINLALALAISVPAINLFTHGTHITVAHAMGSTIGINTMILLASCFYIAVHASSKPFNTRQQRIIMYGFWITNISLLLFWLCLLIAGILKGKGILIDKLSFPEAMQNIHAYLITFAFAGIGIFAGLILVLLPLLKKLAQTEEAK